MGGDRYPGRLRSGPKKDGVYILKKEIDYQKVKDTFEHIAGHNKQPDLTLTATSCPDDPPGFLAYRDRTQKRHIFKVLKFNKEWQILDMGCGAGRWSFAFAKKSKYVLGIDNSPALLKIAENQARRLSISNVRFIESSIIDVSYPERFDLIFVGGVLLYINDDGLLQLTTNFKDLLKPKSKLVLLESISMKERIVKSDSYEKHLQTPYSAIYRRADEYEVLFEQNGFRLEYENDSMARNLPVLIYRKLAAGRLGKNKVVLAILRLGFNLQAFLDPYLLKFSIFKNRAETHQRFFIFEHSS
jgi:SAM-dependent methyltransferase